jgi:prepilin-type N-terminal cleavage/methylation domain-containing protein
MSTRFRSVDRRGQRGFTLIELLVALGISAVLLLGLVSQFSGASSMSYDQNIKLAANLQVQAILQNIGAELRHLGNGVPFEQPGFAPGEPDLADPTVTEPIVVAATTASKISFRINETGEVHLLTANFSPDTSLVVYLTDVEELDANDPIYISDAVMSGTDGFYGTIASVDTAAKAVTINAGAIYYAGTTFVTGSILEEVPIVTYTSPADGSGVTRDSGFGSVLMGAGSTLQLEYLTETGIPLPLPLTDAVVTGSLRAIRVTVSMPSSQKLRSGKTYIGSATQVFALRNLVYVF